MHTFSIDPAFWHGLFERAISGCCRHQGLPDCMAQYNNFRTNLRQGLYVSYRFPAHERAVDSMIVSGSNLYTASSYEKTIRLWDLRIGGCKKVLNAKAGNVRCLAAAGERLISGHGNGAVIAWDIDTGEYKGTLFKDNATIRSLAYANGILFAGSDKARIRAIDIEAGTLAWSFSGHDAPISSLAVYNRTLYSGSWDNSLRGWDLKTGKCAQAWFGVVFPVSFLAIANDRLYVASWDGTIKVRDLAARAEIKPLVMLEKSMDSFAAGDGVLFSSVSSDDSEGSNGAIDICDAATGESICVVSGYRGKISALAFANGVLYVGSQEGTVSVWNFKASEGAIAQEIAGLVESRDPLDVEEGIDRLSFLKEELQLEIMEGASCQTQARRRAYSI